MQGSWKRKGKEITNIVLKNKKILYKKTDNDIINVDVYKNYIELQRKEGIKDENFH